MAKKTIGNVSLPASVYKELCDRYGIKEKRFLVIDALRCLEETRPSEFKVSWLTLFPKGEEQRVSVTKSIPTLLWNNLSAKWQVRTASELLRYAFYVMYAKRFDHDLELDQIAREVVKSSHIVPKEIDQLLSLPPLPDGITIVKESNPPEGRQQ